MTQNGEPHGSPFALRGVFKGNAKETMDVNSSEE